MQRNVVVLSKMNSDLKKKNALAPGCPTALAVTLDAIDRLAARRGDADPAAARYGRRVANRRMRVSRCFGGFGNASVVF